MPDYEKLFFMMVKRLGEITGELSRLHEEVCGQYLEECANELIMNYNNETDAKEN